MELDNFTKIFMSTNHEILRILGMRDYLKSQMIYLSFVNLRAVQKSKKVKQNL